MVIALWAWAGLVAAISGVAIARRARARPVRGASGPVMLVRPCAGAEPGLAERLAELGAWPEPPAVRLSVTDACDPAWPIVEAVAEGLRARGIDARAEVVVAEVPNLKAAQLIHWLAEAPAEGVFANVDSDVDLTGFDGAGLLGALGDAAWTPPSEHAPQTLGDHASAAFLNASLHAFTLLGGLDPAGLVGKVFAVRVAAMRAAGGFAGLDRCLGEDMEIARRLLAQGGHVGLHPAVARAVPHGRSLGAVIARYARWLAVIRAQRPALLVSYPLLFGATTPLVILASALGAAGPLVMCLAARVAVVLAGRHFNARPLELHTVVAAAVLGELVTWLAFLQALRTREVIWRGRRLRILPGGQLE